MNRLDIASYENKRAAPEAQTVRTGEALPFSL